MTAHGGRGPGRRKVTISEHRGHRWSIGASDAVAQPAPRSIRLMFSTNGADRQHASATPRTTLTVFMSTDRECLTSRREWRRGEAGLPRSLLVRRISGMSDARSPRLGEAGVRAQAWGRITHPCLSLTADNRAPSSTRARNDYLIGSAMSLIPANGGVTPDKSRRIAFLRGKQLGGVLFSGISGRGLVHARVPSTRSQVAAR